MRRQKTQPHRGSHLPILMKLLPMTDGPVLELGSGMYSTCFLHWFCFPTKRKLVTYEDHPEWIEFAKQFIADFHDVHHVTDWDKIDLTLRWSVALVDHDPINGRWRSVDVARLVHAEYVVCHDAENKNDRKYHYSTIHDLFRWRWKYETWPNTAVYSNVHDLTEFSV